VVAVSPIVSVATGAIPGGGGKTSACYVIAGTVIIVLGVILGYRPGAGVGGALAALALVVLFAFGLSWVFTTLGLLMRTPNAVMNAGFMGIFPFLSNVFVEPKTLPLVLDAFVEVNPISILATASRGLMEGNAEAGDIAIVLGVAAALTAVFAPLTTRLYRTHGRRAEGALRSAPRQRGRQLGTRAHAELAVDRGQMVFDRSVAQEQGGGHLLVRASPGHQVGDLSLARAQLTVSGGTGTASPGRQVLAESAQLQGGCVAHAQSSPARGV
jgi:hypothetical protein